MRARLTRRTLPPSRDIETRTAFKIDLYFAAIKTSTTTISAKQNNLRKMQEKNIEE